MNKLKGIFNLQKKCVRNVANSNRLSHTDPIFSSLKIMKLNDLFKYNCSMFMHKIAFGKQPTSFENRFTPLGENNRTGNYHIKIYKSIYLDRFPSAFLPKVWNDNSNDIKRCISLSSLKTLLSDKTFSEYLSSEKCQYINCPDCRSEKHTINN